MDATHWHHARHTWLLQHHPQARALQGPTAWSAVAITALVLLQFAIAWALRDASLATLVAAAVLLGAFVAHALGVLIHEAAHNLVVRGGTGNRLWAIFANTPLVIPGAMDFRHQHLLHHKHLGAVESGRDTQAPTAAEVRLVGARSWWRKAAWLTFGPALFQGAHAADKRGRDRWVLANALWQLAAIAAFGACARWRALCYLALSGLLAFGVHPVGIRRYGEHLTRQPEQPTNSYYGLLNLVSFNVGYHVEHHDMPSVPWLRLPALRRLAPELYDGLYAVRSWVGLLARLLLSPWHGPHRYTGVPGAWRKRARASAIARLARGSQ